MRTLYIARLFSGLEASVTSAEWNPTGVPTIYKMLEALDREASQLAIVLTEKKSAHTSLSCRTDQRLRLKGLRSMVKVLAGPGYFPAWLGGLASKLSEVRQLGILVILALRFRPSLIYIDQANIWTAGVLARISDCPVVLRVMGVYPAMRAALVGNRPAHILLRWCYRAPYSLVICTQDGSGVEPWLAAAMSPEVVKLTLVNGVDEPEGFGNSVPVLSVLPPSKCLVLFLGKLERAKGALEFLEGYLRAREMMPGAFHALIVGNGSLLRQMRDRAASVGAEADVSFVERLAHANVWEVFMKCDIYVSLNRLGNLSNANLEAIKAGCCMIIPSSQPATQVDIATDSLIPADAVVRIRSTDSIDELANALVMLYGEPAKRSALQARLRQVGSLFLHSWGARINTELVELRKLAQSASIS